MNAKSLALTLAIVLVLLAGSAQAQPYSEEWTVNYNCSSNNHPYDIAVDANGNSYVSGQVYGDIVTIKYNTDGAQQWADVYNGIGNDYSYRIVIDSSGHAYITGKTYNGSNYDSITIKYNTADGSRDWVSTYNGQDNYDDSTTKIALDPDGNVFVAGYTTVDPGYISRRDGLLIKYNSNGIEQWYRTYNGTADYEDAFNDVATDSNGNVFIVASVDNGYPHGDILTRKYNNNGNVEWEYIYSGEYTGYKAEAVAIAVDLDGNAIMTGCVENSSNNMDWLTIKYKTAGGTWAAWGKKSAGYSIDDEPRAIALDTAGNVYVTGNIHHGYNAATEYRTIKYDTTDGTVIWSKTYEGGTKWDNAQDIAIGADGNVYVTGYTTVEDESDSSTSDYTTIVYDSIDGSEIWMKTFKGEVDGEDKAYAIALDGDNNIYLTGSTENNNGTAFTTVKYDSCNCPNYYCVDGYCCDTACGGGADDQWSCGLQGYEGICTEFKLCCLDEDTDTYADEGTCIQVALSAECNSGYFTFSALTEEDCDPTNPNIHPNAQEVCNGLDDNCVGGADEDGDDLCNNGLYCDGYETCAGVDGCEPGQPITCNDYKDCTIDEPCREGPSYAICDRVIMDDWCLIDRDCYPAGTQRATYYPCQICDPSRDPEEWVNNDGYLCGDDGLFCNGDEVCEDRYCSGHTNYPCPTGWYCSEENKTCHEDEETAIELISFTASEVSGTVALTWETATEANNAGYRLWRSTTSSGDFRQITSNLIPAEGNEFAGASYEFTDSDVEVGATYFYKLEDIDINGVSRFHGPVNVTLEEEPEFGCGVVKGGNYDFALVLLVLGMAILGGRKMKKGYKKPEVKTTSSDEVVKKVGPAQTCSPSPSECPTAQ